MYLVSPVLILLHAFYLCWVDYVWVILQSTDLHCISLVWIHTVILDMLLQFRQLIVDVVNVST